MENGLYGVARTVKGAGIFIFFILAVRAGASGVRGVTRVVMGGYGELRGGHIMGKGKKNLILSKVGKK